jgi:hypothetical protein
MTEDLVAFADFKSVVSDREIRKVGSIPTRPRSMFSVEKRRPSKQLESLSECSGGFDGMTKDSIHYSQFKPMRIFPQHMRIWIPFVVTLWLCAVAFGQEGLRVGAKAPDFELSAIGGKKIALREFQNKKIVIVHFWKSK